jgi:hypothetical protein
MASLGNLLVRGLGIQKNVTEGLELLLQGEQKNCVESLLYLATIWEEGLLGNADLKNVFQIFRFSSKS